MQHDDADDGYSRNANFEIFQFKLGWRFGLVVASNVVGQINEVTLRRAGLAYWDG